MYAGIDPVFFAGQRKVDAVLADENSSARIESRLLAFRFVSRCQEIRKSGPIASLPNSIRLPLWKVRKSEIFRPKTARRIAAPGMGRNANMVT